MAVQGEVPGAARAVLAANVEHRNGGLAAISALDAVLPNVTVDNVLDNVNRTGSGGPTSALYAARFSWQSDDGSSTAWYPQGITTSADYHDDGSYNGRKVVLVSWYDSSSADRGVRLSFVDMTDPNHPAYRHVLLVEPYGSCSAPNFRNVRIHAGGIFWYGDEVNNYLDVVDSRSGFRVFDLNHIWQVTANGDEGRIGKQADGTYMAHNYKHVLPQKFGYRPIAYRTQSPVRFSFASLDRTSTPDSIVVGEYDVKGDGTLLFCWTSITPPGNSRRAAASPARHGRRRSTFDPCRARPAPRTSFTSRAAMVRALGAPW